MLMIPLRKFHKEIFYDYGLGSEGLPGGKRDNMPRTHRARPITAVALALMVASAAMLGVGLAAISPGVAGAAGHHAAARVARVAGQEGCQGDRRRHQGQLERPVRGVQRGRRSSDLGPSTRPLLATPDRPTPSANGSSGAGSKVSGPTARDGGSKGGSATRGRGRGGWSPTADTTGLPPLKQQFAVDDAAFRSAMASVQKTVAKGSATSTRQQMAQALFPLLAAANAYQSQLVNLPFSSSVKPLVQVLTERLGQLTAELEQIQQPGAFFSASAVGAAVSSAEAAVRSASDAVRTQV